MNDSKNLRDYKNSKERREFLETALQTKLDNISQFSFSEEEVKGKNIENLIGVTQIPLGVAGPIKILNSGFQIPDTYIPLATTEGALVASVSRGCKAISQSGGVHVEYHNVGVTRAPVFKTSGIKQNVEVKKWLGKNYEEIKRLCESTSSHLKLLKIDSNFAGRSLFIRFSFDSEDAMGMNMATIATEKAALFIEKETGIKCLSVSGNYDVDKKAAWINFINGRGKQVWADVTLKKEVVENILKTTSDKISELILRKIMTGSGLSGSIGFNAHYANIIAAIFAATGQDLGQVVEGSLGVTAAETLDNGDLYFSIFLPNLMVGTVGGGTNLPTQKEALNIMGIKDSGDTKKFATIIAAAVLAGELSLLASQSAGTLGESHINLGRKGQK
jgi:hydroxymethylglutaryl-CoA reductase (NADPH)